MSVPVSPKGIARKSNDYSARNFPKMNKNEKNANHDSIYTIGENESSAFVLGMAYQRQESSQSRSAGNSDELNKPSYQEPTHSHRKPIKEVNRINMARAIETMRFAQLK